MFNIKTIIIVVVILALAFVGYGFLISGKKKESATGVTKQAVNSSSSAPQANSTNSPGLDGPGKEFVTQLLAIQNIKFNLQLFSDPVFQGLQDWSRDILPQESGRPNPFAPLDSELTSQARLGTGFNGTIGGGALPTSAATTAATAVATSSQSTGQGSAQTTTQTRTINTTTR
jgi:hypothetical protein